MYMHVSKDYKSSYIAMFPPMTPLCITCCRISTSSFLTCWPMCLALIRVQDGSSECSVLNYTLTLKPYVHICCSSLQFREETHTQRNTARCLVASILSPPHREGRGTFGSVQWESLGTTCTCTCNTRFWIVALWKGKCTLSIYQR